MTNEMLRDAFHGIADRAVQPADGIAERALRQASRRRMTMMAGVAAGTIAAVAAPLLFLTLPDDGRQASAADQAVTPSTSVTSVELPDNTPAQMRLAKACVPSPEVKLLASTVNQFQFILVGNEKDHWTCLLNDRGKVSHAYADDQAWDPNKISAPLTILRSREESVGNSNARHTAGVVTPAVARLVMTSLGIKAGEPGYYRVTVPIKTGFFIIGRVSPRGEAQTRLKSELIAYNTAGRVIYKISPVPYR